MNVRILSAVLAAALLVPFATSAAEPATAAAEPAKRGAEAAKEQEPKFSRTQHQVRIAGQVVRYTATAGWLIMKDDAGKPVARFGYTASTRDGIADPARRPVTFVFNGGPGSSSIWLHMGILGPDVDVLLVTASRFDEYPDLHLTDSAFRAPTRVSDGGAQLAPFSWGQAELVRFRNTDGVPLQAVLYKPADFDATRKYPMLVYIYERLSQNLQNFVSPSPGTSINIAYYVSNGYLVLTPDIVYAEGTPGASALKSVLPAIDAVVNGGFVNEDAIGIQGHSWGGYQIAYMVTQTTRFEGGRGRRRRWAT